MNNKPSITLDKSKIQGINLNPVFGDLTNPATMLSHIEQLTAETEAVKHAEILQRLIEQFEPLDFEALANPNNGENFKLGTKHFLVITIENLLSVAAHNRWGLCKNHDFIYLYNGAYWAEIEKEVFQKFLGEAAEQMGVAKFSARHYQFREQLYKQFLATAYLPTPEPDSGKVLINLLNGTFEITAKGAQLRPFTPDDFITYQLPFEYNPEAKAPTFQQYLNRVLPDTERQRVLPEYLGFVFIKHGSNTLKEEKALILYGTGANGKSVFFEVINALLGAENVSSFSLQSLTNENGYFRAKMANKLVNYASEINSNLEASIFKQLVSGEPVEARLPYGQPFMLKQYAKLIFNCNELPKDVEHTNAYFRRFLIIPFDVTIPEHEQDKTLHTKIIENELSGVFNWVLDGLNRLLEQKRFSDCDAAQKAVEQYRTESDSVQMFLIEHEYSISAVGETPLKQMFGEYRNYCIESGFKACSLRTFADRLRNTGYQLNKKNYGQSVNAEKKLCF
ncbi:MAG: phage/plasmid primase, P4 family [Mangrovibacterium sp.]